MTQAGYDSAGLHRYMKKIQAMNGDAAKKASSTHPATTERLNLLQTAINDSGVKPLSQPSGKKRFASYVKKL
jgi:predicted Zn-dependent protease